MWGSALRGSNGACSTLCRFSVTASATHNQIGPLWCWFPSGWACARRWSLWVSLTTSPMRLGVSLAAAPTTKCVFTQRFEALFPSAGALGCAVCCRVCQLLPRRPAALVLQPPRCRESSPPGCSLRPSYGSVLMRLFYLLGCRTSIQFDFMAVWLFFVFKLLLSFFWLCEEAQCVYLCLHLGRKKVGDYFNW